MRAGSAGADNDKYGCTGPTHHHRGSADIRCTFSPQTVPTVFAFLTLHHLSLLPWCFSGYAFFHM
jgi:hypothetical protein